MAFRRSSFYFFVKPLKSRSIKSELASIHHRLNAKRVIAIYAEKCSLSLSFRLAHSPFEYGLCWMFKICISSAPFLCHFKNNLILCDFNRNVRRRNAVAMELKCPNGFVYLRSLCFKCIQPHSFAATTHRIWFAVCSMTWSH